MEKFFKTSFSSSKTSFQKIKFEKTNSTFDSKINTSTSVPTDVVYDEVIYYDGGGVDGYGYD